MIQNISLKKFLIFGSAAVLLATLALTIANHVLLGNLHDNAAQGQHLEHAMLLAKDARFETIQVQQFLTDAGATADDGSFAEAAASRDRAIEGLRALAANGSAPDFDAPSVIAALERLHATGVTMARAYIDSGRDAGNVIMKRSGDGFDEQALYSVFADRADGHLSVNRYHEDDQGTATNGVVIAVPAERRIRACRGPADRGEWVEHRFTR